MDLPVSGRPATRTPLRVLDVRSAGHGPQAGQRGGARLVESVTIMDPAVMSCCPAPRRFRGNVLGRTVTKEVLADGVVAGGEAAEGEEVVGPGQGIQHRLPIRVDVVERGVAALVGADPGQKEKAGAPF